MTTGISRGACLTAAAADVLCAVIALISVRRCWPCAIGPVGERRQSFHAGLRADVAQAQQG